MRGENLREKIMQYSNRKGNMVYKKSPLDMNYNELNDTLNFLLNKENLPSSVVYRSNRIKNYRYSKSRLIVKLLLITVQAGLIYRKHIYKKLGSFRKAVFLKSFKLYFILCKILLPGLLTRFGGRFDDKLVVNYMTAAMLYDASCDIPRYRKYLKEFDRLIMLNIDVEPNDEYLRLFRESMDYLKNNLDKKTYDTFMRYIRIEHISQLMSLYQLSDKLISRDDLFKITLSKGGIAILAGMHILAPKMGELERKAIYEIGGILQIFEDIKDIKEDLKMEIKTMANQKMINYQELKQLYFGTVNNLIEKCNLDSDHPNLTLDILHWFADVMLEQKYKSFKG